MSERVATKSERDKLFENTKSRVEKLEGAIQEHAKKIQQVEEEIEKSALDQGRQKD